jgi:hypothetical protein
MTGWAEGTSGILVVLTGMHHCPHAIVLQRANCGQLLLDHLRTNAASTHSLGALGDRCVG